MWPLRPRNVRVREIDPDEIFLDSSNLSHLDSSQFEGRVERPIARLALLSAGIVFALCAVMFLWRSFSLQVVYGEEYAKISRENRLERTVIFASRGIIYDRNGEALAWNEATPQSASTTEATSTLPHALRHYVEMPGFSHILGFVRYPKQDAAGQWWREEYAGVSGAEFVYDELLGGENGSRLVETDARGQVVRAHMVIPPETGADVALSIDADVQSTLARLLSAHAETHGFRGGAAVIMDVANGELLALTSFPEYNHVAFSEGDADIVRATNNDSRTPLLNRAVAGLYTPGSIVKPIFAAAALAENLISPEKEIFSSGQLIVPNPYNPDKPTIFRDWKAHGWVDMRRALAVSSDQYFYTIGGGFEGQKGLGIERLDEYARRFGLGSETGIVLSGEQAGVIPTPEWKESVFGPDDPWRIGDTYITSIGQFGFQITPLQAVRFSAAVANGGKLPTPQLVKNAVPVSASVGIDDVDLQIVREGMRQAVTDGGTAAALNVFGIDIAGKTGTAEVGERNQFMNSWVIGFWPAEKPRYAFAVVLERAPAGTLSGAAPAMRAFFEWLVANKSEYVKPNE